MVELAPVYARVDLVRGDDSQWLLTELELIEPSLSLRMEPGAPCRFAQALDQHFIAHLNRDPVAARAESLSLAISLLIVLLPKNCP